MLEFLYDTRYAIPHHAPPIYIEVAVFVMRVMYVECL